MCDCILMPGKDDMLNKTESQNISETTQGRARLIVPRIVRHENFVLTLVFIGLVFAMGGATGGKSLAIVNIKNVMAQGSIRGVAAVGEAFVILSGGIDLSVGGIALFSNLLGGGLMTLGPACYVDTPWPLQATVVTMVVVGGIWGMLNGLSVARNGIPPLIATLAMWEITKGAGYRVCGGQLIGFMPEGLKFFGSHELLGLPVPAVIFIVVCAIAYFILNHTTFGRSIFAVGGNQLSALLSGIPVKRIQLWTYIIAGLLAGLAGLIVTARAMAASMSVLGGLELDAIAAVVIGGVSLMGGRGNLIGVIIGVVIIGVINNGMGILGAGPDVQGIVKGVIIYTAVTIDFIRRRKE